MAMKFYTYCHIRLDTGKIFYIGKGSGKRLYSKTHRNLWWKNITNKTKYVAEILSYWASEEDAFIHEKFLISILPNLVNQTLGGDGASGYKHTAEQNRKKSLKMKEYHRNNPYKAKIWSLNKKALHVDDEWKIEHSRKMKLMHADPDFKDKFSKAQRKARARIVVSSTGDLKFEAVIDCVNWLRARGYSNLSSSYLSQCIKLERRVLGILFKYGE